MTTLRCTQALLKILGRQADPQPPTSTTALGDWYAKPVPTAAGDLVVLMSGVTYLSVALPIEEIAALERLFPMRVYNLLRHLGVPEPVAAGEMRHYDKITFARTDSRKRVGILNEIAFNYQWHAEARLDEGQPLYLSEAEKTIAGSLFGAPDYVRPDEATRTLLIGQSNV